MGEHDLAVLIARFQPPHRFHLALIRRGLAQAPRVLVLSGAARRARSTETPFRFEEVRACLLGALGAEERALVEVLPLMDRYEEEAWRAELAAAAGSAARVVVVGAGGEELARIGRFFPDWAAGNAAEGGARTKEIREDYLAGAEAALARWRDELPGNVEEFLRAFAGSAEYGALAEEAAYIAEYRAAWAGAPWPPIFVTVDAVVICGGRVLLVERANAPGKGLWALPGGFVEVAERIRAAMLRELAEETGLAMAEGEIAARIRDVRVFDAPCRSARGRTITHAFLILLEEGREPPKVAGGDDAARAFWTEIEEIEPERMFEDHWQIIEAMLASGRGG